MRYPVSQPIGATRQPFRDGSNEYSPFTCLAELNAANMQFGVYGASLPSTGSCLMPVVSNDTIVKRLRRSAKCVAESVGHYVRPDALAQDGFAVENDRRKARRFSSLKLHTGQSKTRSAAAVFIEPSEPSPPPYSESTPTSCVNEHLSQSLYPASYVATIPSTTEKSASFACRRDAPPVENRELAQYNQLDMTTESRTSRFTESVALSLDDIFHGKHLLWHFTRKHLSGDTSRESLSMIVPPGCPSDMVFSFPNSGHELRNGTFQDINFLVVEKPHPLQFKRSGDDLFAQLSPRWTDCLNDRPRLLHISGIGGETFPLEIDYRRTKMVHGVVTFRGAGMPRLKGKGRGDLIIEWELDFGSA